MAAITLEYDKKDSSVKNKKVYDSEFVAKIRKAEKESSKKLNLAKYGISI